MKIRTIILLATTVMALNAVATAELETDKLVDSIDNLKTYTYGNTNGVDLGWLERQVGMASADAGARIQVEQALIDALSAATTDDAKQFYCRQLRTIGTDTCVPLLESMLTDMEISHMARYALGRIGSPAAVEALRRALGKTSGKVKAGMINTLAQINCAKGLSDYLKAMDDSDTDVAVAGIRAVGKFPCDSSIAKLQKMRKSVSRDFAVEIDAALLRSAETLLADGNKAKVQELYEAFYASDYPEHLRTAGLRGLAKVKGEEAADLLVEAIQGDDGVLRRNAIALMALIKGKKTTDTFVKLSKTLPADGQELIVLSLGERGDVSAVSAVIGMTASEHENVRLAALEALGDIGTPEAITCLAKAAANAGDKEKQVARSSLMRMRGPGIEKAFIQEVNVGEASSRVEVIRTIGQRSSSEPSNALLNVAMMDEDALVRREAIMSLGRIGHANELDALVGLAVAPKDAGDRSTIERAIVIVSRKIADQEAQAGPLLKALKSAPDDAQGMLLRLLAKPATADALNAVRMAVRSTNSAINDAAIRALGEWPNGEPADELYQIASTNSNQVLRIMALRSFIRMAPLTSDPTEAYVKAMRLATRVDEIRLVLSGLHYAGTLTALEIAEKYMTNDAVKAEAYLAAVQVANVYCWQDATRARGVLDKVIAEAPNDAIKNQARDVINNMAKSAGMIIVWRGAGPYVLKGIRDGKTVFSTVFEPEKNPDAKDIVWQVIRPEFERDSWLRSRINLEQTFGSIDYCCAYLRTIVHSPVAQEVKVEWAADDFMRVWMNGEPVEGNLKAGANTVMLKAGANTLMLKVGDHDILWNFQCRLLKPDGSAVEGLKFEPK